MTKRPQETAAEVLDDANSAFGLRREPEPGNGSRPLYTEMECSRRHLLRVAGAGAALLMTSSEILAAFEKAAATVKVENRFPYFLSTPVAYPQVKLNDIFWAPRQTKVREVTIAWATKHWDEAGGLEAYKANPSGYRALTQPGDMGKTLSMRSCAYMTMTAIPGTCNVSGWPTHLPEGA
jgi:hypothetical protein